MCRYLLLKVSNSVSIRLSLQMTHPNVASGGQPAISVQIVLGDVIRYFSIVGILASHLLRKIYSGYFV